MECTHPRAEHAWLRKLCGSWNATSQMWSQPDAEPTTWESHESTGAVGDLWIVTEGSADFGGESPYASRMTLGYDERRGHFVGSWIDSMQGHMWSYVGHLDVADNTLTLEAEGPSMHDPSVSARYRDQLELVDGDTKRMTSSILDESGEWKTFMRVEARRAEAPSRR